MQLHPVSSLGLAGLSTSSLQGGPDGTTLSGTTTSERPRPTDPSRANPALSGADEKDQAVIVAQQSPTMWQAPSRRARLGRPSARDGCGSPAAYGGRAQIRYRHTPATRSVTRTRISRDDPAPGGRTCSCTIYDRPSGWAAPSPPPSSLTFRPWRPGGLPDRWGRILLTRPSSHSDPNDTIASQRELPHTTANTAAKIAPPASSRARNVDTKTRCRSQAQWLRQW